MKALKYGLTLVLGLTMLGFSARVQAQTSSQTANVVPAHATPLPAVPVQTINEPAQAEEQPQRGMVTPRAIEEMVINKDFENAVKEFEKYMKTAKGDLCDLLYLPWSFYDYLRMEDPSKTDFYKEKADYYLNQFMQTCGNTVDGYLMKESMGERNPDSTVVRMTAAIKLEPEYAQLYSMRGDALWQLGRTEEACADFKKAMELQQNYEFAIDFYRTNCSYLEQQEEQQPAE